MVENVSIFIPKYLKVLRTAGNLTQKDMAALCGLSRPTIIKVEKEQNVNRSWVLAIFTALVLFCKDNARTRQLFKALWKVEFGEEFKSDFWV